MTLLVPAESVNTRVFITLFMTNVIHGITATSYDKFTFYIFSKVSNLILANVEKWLVFRMF